MLTLSLIVTLITIVYLIMGIGVMKLSIIKNKDLSFEDALGVTVLWPFVLIGQSFS